MLKYIPGDIFKASCKFSMGNKLREKMEGGKRAETCFSVHFNVHTPKQIVLKQFENFRSPFQNETLHQERSQDMKKY
jgi:hypothetical protein